MEEAYTSNDNRQCIVTKIVRYKCGCEVTLHEWGPWKKASNVCEKHGADIVRITTIKDFFGTLEGGGLIQ